MVRHPIAGSRARFGRYRELFFIALTVLLAASIVLFLANKDKYHIPSTITKQLNFPILFLNKPSGSYQLEQSSIKYVNAGNDGKVFSYIVNDVSNPITITEQAYPEALIYDKLTNSINPYSEVGTIYGATTLGRPKDGGGGQVAVLKYGDGTLIFMRPQADVSNGDWLGLINSLEPVK